MIVGGDFFFLLLGGKHPLFILLLVRGLRLLARPLMLDRIMQEGTPFLSFLK